MAVEEQYYVFFPLLLLFFWGYGKKITLAIIVFITVVSFVVADQNLLNDSSANFYLIISRLWELGVGSIVAFLIPLIKRQRVSDEIFSAIGLMAIAYSIAFFSDLTPFPGRFALLPTIGTALIIIFCSPNTLVGRIFTLKYVVWIGLISYSLYLWHQPIFAFLRVRSIGHPSPEMFILSITLAILMAYLSYRYVEKPFRHKQKINRGQIFQFSGITTVIVISIGLFGSFKEGFPGRMDQKVLDTLEYSNSYSSRTKACWKAIEEESYLKSELCILGDQKVSPQYVLLGDSHSAVIIDPLRDALASINKSAINLSYNTCLPIKGGSFSEKGKTQKSCDKLRGWVFSNLDDLPNTFILLARWSLFVNSSRFDNQEGGIESGKRVFWDMELASSDYQLALLDEYERGISTLIDAGKNVVLIYPVPEAGWVVPLEIAKRLHFDIGDGGQNLSTSYDQYLTRNSKVLERFDILSGGERLVRVIPSGLFCSKETERCLNAINGVPLYYDDDHLSLPGAKMLTAEILLKLTDQGWL